MRHIRLAGAARRAQDLVLAASAAVAPPAVTAYALVHGVAGGFGAFNRTAGALMFALALTVLAAHGLAKGSPVRYILGLATIGLSQHLLGPAPTGALTAIALSAALGVWLSRHLLHWRKAKPPYANLTFN